MLSHADVRERQAHGQPVDGLMEGVHGLQPFRVLGLNRGTGGTRGTTG